MPPQGGRKHPHQEFIQIDTTNVLFILRWRVLRARADHRAAASATRASASTAPCARKADRDPGELFAQVLPEDLVKFGHDPRVHRPPADDRRRAQPRPRRAGQDPHRAEELAGQAVPEGVRVRRRRARVHRRRPRGHRRPGAAARHRRPRPAGDPRRGAAQHDVRPARAAPTSARSLIDDDTVRDKANPTLVPRKTVARARPRRAAS